MTKRNHGIDALRVVFAICVVMVHLGYVAPSAIFEQEAFSQHTFSWSDFLNFYVLLAAVPQFLLISLFLQVGKITDRRTLLKRVRHILLLLVFWATAYNAFIYAGWGITDSLPRNVSDGLGFVLSGGWTIYYFFVSLVFTTCLLFLIRNFSFRTTLIFFVASVLFTAAIPFLAILTGKAVLVVYWNPLQFVCYPFAALLIRHLLESRPDRAALWAGVFLVVGALLATLDWTVYKNGLFLKANQFAIPAYCRPSLLFISMSVFLFAHRYLNRESRVVGFLSGHTLSLYCIHPFFIPLFENLEIGLLPKALIIFALVLLLVQVLQIFIKKEFVKA